MKISFGEYDLKVTRQIGENEISKIKFGEYEIKLLAIFDYALIYFYHTYWSKISFISIIIDKSSLAPSALAINIYIQ